MQNTFIAFGITLAVASIAACGPTNDLADLACDDTQCVSLSAVSANISAALDGKVVGYVSYVGAPLGNFVAGGVARTTADAPAVDFTSETQIQVASVSKTVTALAAMAILAQYKIDLTSPIGSYLPPDWNVSPDVAAITFEELLSHTSGIHDSGDDTAQDDADVEQEFQAIVPTDKSYFYSNYNYSVFRILLPIIAGVDDSDTSARPTMLATAYVSLLQKYVYEPVGLTNVECKPPTNNVDGKSYAFSYQFPGTTKGYDSGDLTLRCGRAGWYLSASELATILLSINDGDGRIVTKQQSDTMEQQKLGWDTNVDATGYRYLSKPGDWGPWNGTWLHTAIAIFGPGVIGVLLFNSDIAGSPNDTAGTATTVLHDAYMQALKPKG